jgi:hypothetical protein
VDQSPPWIRIPCGDETEEIEQMLQEVFRNGYFEYENNGVQEDKHPCNERKSYAWNGVLQRDHGLGPHSCSVLILFLGLDLNIALLDQLD